LLEPGIEAASVYIQNSAHGSNCVLLESLPYERVFFFDPLAKNTAASLSIYRSYVTLRS